MSNQVWVIGHRNPDTDSIVSAIAYSHLKNEIWRREGSPLFATPGRLGSLNAETEYILQRFAAEVPELLPDLWARVRDVMQKDVAYVYPDTPLIEIGRLIREKDLRTIPVVDRELQLQGIVSVGDVAKKYFAENQIGQSEIPLTVDNLIQAVEGTLLTASERSTTLSGRVLIGAMSPETMVSHLSSGDILLIGDRENAQTAAIAGGCACLIITGGLPVAQQVLATAAAQGVIVISSPLDTYTAARRINMSLPVSSTMNQGALTFGPDDLLDEVREKLVKYKHRNYPVVDEEQRLLGLLSRGNLLAGPAKKVILVDHNELGQSVAGLIQAEILEIVDHHRLGDVQTDNPVFFRNEPVGSTATLVAECYHEEGVAISAQMAGLLVSAILSDTLIFQSPTTTAKDRRIAQELAELAGIADLTLLGRELLEAGSDTDHLTAEQLITEDLKTFAFGADFTVGVAQVETSNLERFLERGSELMEEMERYRQNNRLDLFLLLVTDLFRQGSELLVTGPAQHIVEKAFGYPLQGNKVFLPGVLSRKKQVIPPLGKAVQEVQI